jgi:murein DD-endopeptidase MepM/ murein hydrolase activator NlpD
VKRVLAAFVAVFVGFIVIRSSLDLTYRHAEPENSPEHCREICGTVKKGESLYDIFRKYKLEINDLLELKEASADIYKLKELDPGQKYRIVVDDDKTISSFVYWIDDDSILDVTRTESGFSAGKKQVKYEKKILSIAGQIKDNLVSSLGDGRENMLLAFQLSDIFAWDIDFTTDLRNDDVFKIVVEGLFLQGKFKKYGNILSVEFINNGDIYRAYRFGPEGNADYYDAYGNSLKKSFLKAPLSFRRISSTFTERRFHPILKIYRPHHGLDYAAPAGTPVSTVGDGTVLFSGYKGEYGKLVVVRHKNNWKTYYGHLSRIGKHIKSGTSVRQGQVIGYVGSTGLATGPHLHYEIRVHNRAVNPLEEKIPRGKSISGTALVQFRNFKDEMDRRLAAIKMPYFALAGRSNNPKM